MRMLKLAVVLLVAVLPAGCATSPAGRPQLILVDDRAVDRMGAQAFQQIRGQLPESRDERAIAMVECIVEAIAPAIDRSHVPKRWQVAVFADRAVNAFALPGGYIGVYEGLLEIARNQHQVAAVIGHEMAHVTSRHAAERISQHETTGFAVRVLAGRTGSERTAALLGLGAQVGILLPFSRTQETEADVLGLEYMARAGFDPNGAVDLWRNMEADRDRGPPEFLSTHPSSRTRIDDLLARMPEAESQLRQARALGRTPECE